MPSVVTGSPLLAGDQVPPDDFDLPLPQVSPLGLRHVVDVTDFSLNKLYLPAFHGRVRDVLPAAADLEVFGTEPPAVNPAVFAGFVPPAEGFSVQDLRYFYTDAQFSENRPAPLALVTHELTFSSGLRHVIRRPHVGGGRNLQPRPSLLVPVSADPALRQAMEQLEAYLNDPALGGSGCLKRPALSNLMWSSMASRGSSRATQTLFKFVPLTVGTTNPLIRTAILPRYENAPPFLTVRDLTRYRQSIRGHVIINVGPLFWNHRTGQCNLATSIDTLVVTGFIENPTSRPGQEDVDPDEPHGVAVAPAGSMILDGLLTDPAWQSTPLAPALLGGPAAFGLKTPPTLPVGTDAPGAPARRAASHGPGGAGGGRGRGRFGGTGRRLTFNEPRPSPVVQSAAAADPHLSVPETASAAPPGPPPPPLPLSPPQPHPQPPSSPTKVFRRPGSGPSEPAPSWKRRTPPAPQALEEPAATWSRSSQLQRRPPAPEGLAPEELE